MKPLAGILNQGAVKSATLTFDRTGLGETIPAKIGNADLRRIECR